MNHEQQSALINDYLACDSKIKQLEKLRDEMKKEIIALGEGSHSTSEGQVSVSVSERRTLSQDLMKKFFNVTEFPEELYSTSKSVTVRVTKY